MASARGRRRTQQGRRSQKERGPQHGRRQKSHPRRSLAKQRKHRGQVKHERKRASKRFFHTINTKMLNKIRRDRWFVSPQAKRLTISFMEDNYEQVERG